MYVSKTHLISNKPSCDCVTHQLKKTKKERKVPRKERKKVAGRSRAIINADASNFEEKDFGG